MSLEAAVESWIRLANEKNGYDNTSVVATHCRMSPERLVLFDPAVASAPASAPVSASVSLPPSLPRSLQKSGTRPESKLSESSKQLLYPETSTAPEPVQKRGFQASAAPTRAVGADVSLRRSRFVGAQQLPKPPARVRTTSATAGNSRPESCGNSLARGRESLAVARIDSCGNSLARGRESLAVARIDSCGNSLARRSGNSFAITGVREIN
jgi:hypothetical protein